MRLATLVTATALGLGGFATAYLYHDKSDPPQRYGSWQELSAAQPSCKSMTNLSECILQVLEACSARCRELFARGTIGCVLT